MMLSPAARVQLERRIAEEGMIALDPPFAKPDWLCEVMGGSALPHAFTMNADGSVPPRWTVADEVDWSTVAAVRLETSWGRPLSPDLDLDFDDEDEQ